MKTNNVNNTLYMIGNAHLDPVWLWQWQEGYAEIKATFQAALDRMNEFDDFTFTCGSIGQFEWVEKNCPKMFEEIVRRVGEGRWNIVGGWWVQPDCNSPSGESFVRHSLYAQRYLKEKFNLYATTGYNVDSFGHNCMIPQILKKSGMNNYIFMRPSAKGKTLPDPLFLWESPDKSQVLAFRILDDHYNNSYRSLDTLIEDALVRKATNTDQLMLFFGVGNHGGGPTIKALNIIQQLQEKFDKETLFVASPDQYFDTIRSKNITPPIFKGEIQHHASGCYATHYEFKKSLRHIEQLLLTTERWHTIAKKIVQCDDATARLTDAWKVVLFNQFHDILGGCSIQDALTDAEDALSYAKHITSDILNDSIQKISWSINTLIPGVMRSKEESGRLWAYANHPVPLIVFNPLPFPVKTHLPLDVKLHSIQDVHGNDIPIQTIIGRYLISNQNKGTLFLADVPALGYTTYWLRLPEIPKEKPVFKPDPVLSPSYTLENQWTRVTFDPVTGHIISLYDKINEIEHLSNPSAIPLVMDEEAYDTWGHGNDTYNDLIGQFTTDQVQLIEDGPIRSTIRVTSTYGHSQLRQDFSLYTHSPDLDVALRINWQEKHKLLKLAFEVNTNQPVATYSIPYGHIERPCNGKEEPGQMWMDISDKDSSIGLSLACQARYSYSAQHNSMRLNVIRSPLYADHEAPLARHENFEPMDQGIHKLTYKLIMHAGSWKQSSIIEKSLILNSPLIKVHETYHAGSLPQTTENIIISNTHILLSVMKAREDVSLEGTILRLHETKGAVQTTSLQIPLLKVDTTLTFSPFEIKTLLIHPTGLTTEVNLIELPTIIPL